mmetsp:Transcript_7148/g.15509  ORF Transcript_7148/g.15509 Transcript_7148/m.15509 type:complete len:404 (-) Transcript_7148:219-1430(-)
MASARAVYVIAAKRTPFGSFGGSLKKISATDLAVEATKSAFASLPEGTVSASDVGECYVGNVIQSSPDAAYCARHVGLMAGIPTSTPALTINRLCGSGFETVAQGTDAIRLGKADVAICAGTENMSSAPFVADGNAVRWGVNLGSSLQLEDSLWAGLTDRLAGTPMGMTAENLAEKYGITREECDDYAIRSQKTWAEAKEAGRFDMEIAPIEITGKNGAKETIDTDEHPRPDISLEKIAKLKPVFKKNGVVTAANASGICDGAGSIILASEEIVLKHDLKPLARIAAYHTSGCDPTIMGIGPVPAIRAAAEFAGISVCDADRIEINEAFAAQYLACEKELGLDRSKTNVNGGAISLGHPLGASGSRIMAHLAHEYSRTEGNRYFIGAACIGGGQGVAVILERT